MPRAATVTVTLLSLEVLDIEPGHWCDRCALPSAAIITLASQVAIGGREQPLRLSRGLRCLDGHGWIQDTEAC